MAAAADQLSGTVRGIPWLDLGEGVEFLTGAPQDVAGARDPLAQTGRAYFGDHLTGERIRATKAHPLYRRRRRLNRIRRAIPAWAKPP